ncbi:hypothetical protein [Streptomyces sp. NPDC050560]
MHLAYGQGENSPLPQSGTFELAVPGVECHYEERDGRRTACLVHADGS